MRENSNYSTFPKKTVSISYQIMKYMIIDDFNGSKTNDKLDDKYSNKKMERRLIYEIIDIIRKSIEHYYLT